MTMYFPLGYDDGVDPLGGQLGLESLGALAAEKSFAEVVHDRGLPFARSIVR